MRKRASVVYIASGSEVLDDERFHKFVETTPLRVTSKSALAIPEVQQLAETDADGYGSWGREELAAVELAILRKADFFLGWQKESTLSWMGVQLAHGRRMPGAMMMDYVNSLPTRERRALLAIHDI